MKIIHADSKKQQRDFLRFRKNLYKSRKLYIDNNYFMIQEIFSGKLNYTKKIHFYPVSVQDEQKNIVAEGIIVYAPKLPEYIQLCFFEALEGQQDAVELLIFEANRIGRMHNCSRMVIGLCGHVNYGLGLQNSHYGEVNTFSSPANDEYYNEYFRKMGCDEVLLNSYQIAQIDNRLERYQALLRKLENKYEFRIFDKKQFDYYSKIYTDLNNACFANHRYYYERDYEDDKEMLKELFYFMKEDSLIFAFLDGKPVAFVMWYPDFNELVKKGDAFGTKHFFVNLLKNKKIKTAKVMEFGVLEEYKKVGLPLALLHQIFGILKNYGCTSIDTSWVLEENLDSNSICQAVCDKKHKEFVVYERTIE